MNSFRMDSAGTWSGLTTGILSKWPISLDAFAKAEDRSAKGLPEVDFSINTLGAIVPFSTCFKAAWMSFNARGAIIRLSYARNELTW